MIDTEPHLAEMLENRKGRRSLPPYIPQEDGAIRDLLITFFADKLPGAAISGVSRMGGGASKEQFVFTLTQTSGQADRFVLRMDPLEAITETSRKREFEVLEAFEGIVPVPRPAWMDADGSIFPRPAMIMEMVRGTTKPSDIDLSVTGIGTVLGGRLRKLIRPQYLEMLAKIHNFDWANANLPSFAAPLADPKQATRWLINFWKELLNQDVVAYEPIIRLATQYLEANIPDCDKVAFVHGDFRTGNYLFDEHTGNITAILDWEMSYIGDYHADFAWLLAPVFGTKINGVFRASDIFEGEEDFITSYEAVSGNVIDRNKLHYFKIFNYWKSYILVSVLGMRAANAQHNHQDVLLTFLAATGPMHLAELANLLSMGEVQ
ncbi:phosphotransferase [Novosphingobium sp. FGD1]|uniref:Phosphotransferase n=1 Tax=Novosphingobium silvae TaxID=2692619 RepID=A0A7X4GL82_9SPHN|nr:phosphotransferase [Novosphingobium silvae]